MDPIHGGEFPGSGIEDRERSDREGRVYRVDPKCARGPQTAVDVIRTEVADGPLADLAELGVPVRLPLVEVEMPIDAMDLPESYMPDS